MSTNWIVAYDISRDRDRERVAATLLGSGVRLQRSVFEVSTDDAQQLLEDCSKLIRVEIDVIQAFRQCQACADLLIGVGQTSPSMREAWWVA